MQFLANQALGRRKFVLRKTRQPPSRVRLPDRCPFFVHSTALSFRFFPFRFVLSPAMSPLRLNPIQVHFLVQRAPAYAQQSGGLFPIMPGLFQSLAYPLLFHAFPFQGFPDSSKFNSSAVTNSPWAKSTADWTACFSSRTFPGQSWASNRFFASASKPFTCLPCSWL